MSAELDHVAKGFTLETDLVVSLLSDTLVCMFDSGAVLVSQQSQAVRVLDNHIWGK